MTRRAFVFPGQGSQAIGMGKDLNEAFPECREFFSRADQALGFSISKICFEGPEEELKKTANTQPALLATSIAVFDRLKSKGTAFEAVAGHSLGAYSALVAASVFSFEDAVRLVRRRGELMEQAGAGKGTMAVILNLDEDKVRQACQEASAQGLVEPANVNCPGQIVISGEKTAVLAACEKAKALGAKRAMELPVSGPFHSSLMKEAAEGLREALASVKLSKPQVTYYSDIDAEPLSGTEAIAESLVRQLVAPVQWIKTIEAMSRDGFGTFVEVGSGKVLSGLIRKIKPDAIVYNVGDVRTLAEADQWK